MDGTGTRFDILLVGGGLQSALIALAVFARRPGARVAIVEGEERLGGNHTWCFHASDVPAAAQGWLAPLVAERWPRWEVRFPRLTRTFESGYAAITSDRLDEVLRAQVAVRPGSAIFLGARAREIGEARVVLESGSALEGALVVDARGPAQWGAGAGGADGAPRAYQKFLGLELEVEEPSKVAIPIIMDACVEQLDGFRFVYALPFPAAPAQPEHGRPAQPARVLIEETHFSDGPALDEPALTARALESARRLGLRVASTLRTERGVLPLPLSWPADAPDLEQARGPLLAGYQGGFFHPTTGYSLPIALRVAEQVAAAGPGQLFGPGWRSFVSEQSRQARFAVLLNRLLFRATPPGNRREVLERFHRLPAGAVARFYALQSSRADRLRILCGRPPRGVSFGRALREAARA